jgi:mannose-1-phosphate guanylyltransferase
VSGTGRRSAAYAVILAGGGGTRLWPLSDPERPKPFLPLLPDSRSLLQHTVDRLAGPHLRLPVDDIWVVTDRRYVPLVRDQLPGIAVLAEPQGRNTGPAVALATLAIDRPGDDVMIVLPADHLMRDAEFNGVLARAVGELAPGVLGIDSPIVTLGAQPSHPATGYGYLTPDPARQQTPEAGLHACVLDAFVEKPDHQRAVRLLAEHPGVAWNAGIFIARRRAFRAAFERYTSLITTLAPAIGTSSALARAYQELEPRSIDYAVMEHAAADGQVVMAAMDVGWSDLGSWTALIDALVQDGYASPARVIPGGETVDLGGDDLAVVRNSEGVLELRSGPAHLTSPRPMAFVPRARQHENVLDELLARVNEWSGKPVEAGVRA